MPSVATLIALASRLNIKVGDLFEASPTAHGVLKAQERVAYEANPGVTDVILSLDGSDKLEVILGYIAPGAGSGEELYEHGADTEFVLVMKGEIEVQLGAEAVVLEEGDALTFSGDVKHGYLNRTSEPVELLWVMTPATY
jgi:quercetin dioxygenase-like cupin family protein